MLRINLGCMCIAGMWHNMFLELRKNLVFPGPQKGSRIYFGDTRDVNKIDNVAH
jgi:hypothetical protein